MTYIADRDALAKALLHAQHPDNPDAPLPMVRAGCAGILADALIASGVAKGWHEGWRAGIRDERAWGAAPNELRVAALAHAIECYSGPNDDTIPVLRRWLHDLSRIFPHGDPEDSCCTCGDPVAGAICHHVLPPAERSNDA